MMSKDAPKVQPPQATLTGKITYNRETLLQFRDLPASRGFPVGANIVPGVIEPPNTDTTKQKPSKRM